MSRENQKVSIKVNGSFYVGDICYCLKEKVYYGIWCDKYDFEDGAFTDPNTGLQFATVSTAYGDGEYYDNNGNSFPVDAGNIGIVDMGLSKCSAEKLKGLGMVYDYIGEVSIEYEDGDIYISFGDKSIQIATGDDEDYWPDPADEEEDE